MRATKQLLAVTYKVLRRKMRIPSANLRFPDYESALEKRRYNIRHAPLLYVGHL